MIRPPSREPKPTGTDFERARRTMRSRTFTQDKAVPSWCAVSVRARPSHHIGRRSVGRPVRRRVRPRYRSAAPRAHRGAEVAPPRAEVALRARLMVWRSRAETAGRRLVASRPSSPPQRLRHLRGGAAALETSTSCRSILRVRVNGVLGIEMKTLPVNDPSTVTGAKTYRYRLRARSQTNEVQDIHAGRSGSFVVRRVRASAPLSSYRKAVGGAASAADGSVGVQVPWGAVTGAGCAGHASVHAIAITCTYTICPVTK